MVATAKWSAFTAGSAIGGSDILVGLQSGGNVRWTFSQLATYVQSVQDEQNLIAALDTAVKAGGLAVAAPCIDLTIKIQNAPVEPDEPGPRRIARFAAPETGQELNP